VLTITSREYVEAARALGPPRLAHRLPSRFPERDGTIVIQASLNVAFAILAEASLSFLGRGPTPEASWAA